MDGTLTKSTTQTLTLEDRRMNIHSTDQGYDENVDAANIYLDNSVSTIERHFNQMVVTRDQETIGVTCSVVITP